MTKFKLCDFIKKKKKKKEEEFKFCEIALLLSM